MNRDIAETLAGYIAHPSEYNLLYSDIMIIYKPANTIIMRYKNNNKLYIFIYNKFINKINPQRIDKCCHMISCKRNIYNLYNIPYLIYNTTFCYYIYNINIYYNYINGELYDIYDLNNHTCYNISDGYYYFNSTSYMINLHNNHILRC